MSLTKILQSKFFLYSMLALVLSITSCGSDGGQENALRIIQNSGSDTMVNVAQAWAEAYAKIHPEISVEVSGGGSGTGIAALINGTVQVVNCSREMKAMEIESALKNSGKTPLEVIVGYDALAVYVHKDNPLEEISIAQLADIYGENGQTTLWSELNVKNNGCSDGNIIRVSRQSNSGTYDYFRATLLGEKGDFKLGSTDLHGSKDVVELVERTPCALGYSGMGYATEHVKMLKIRTHASAEAFGPSVENVLNDTYPIARPLFMYFLGEPTGDEKAYLEWILSDEGQKIVAESGYVPVPADKRKIAVN